MSRGLGAALDSLLPAPDQTLLLGACLTRGADARSVWDELATRLGSPGVEALVASAPHLVPLLDRAASEHRLDVEPSLRRRLKAATLREELRSSALRKQFVSALTRLRAASVDTIVTRGTAVAELAYPAPALRHCHDLDLLVREDDATAARGALNKLGPLPVSVHVRLFDQPAFTVPLDWIWHRSRPATIAGVATQSMDPADLLFHLCAHAFAGGRRAALTWVADALFTLHRWPDLDWDVVAADAEASRVSLPTATVLRYLAQRLAAPVPAQIIERLENAPTEAVDRELVRSLAWHSARSNRPTLSLLRWKLLPSPGYLRLTEKVRSPGGLPLYYAAQPPRLALRRIRGTVRG